jgi:hypothetical protein
MLRKSIFTILLLFAVLAGCNNSTSQIGAGFISKEQFDVTSVDTLSLWTSTAIFDSLSTFPFASAPGRLLIGHHDDEKLGSITSATAFALSLPANPNLDLHTTVYTALSLVFRYDTYSYYDTLGKNTISVYRLNQRLFLNPKALSLYNVDKFSYDPTVLGTLTFAPKPHSRDSIEIYLPDDLGKQLMTMAQTNDVNFTTNDNFNKFLNGFAIIPDTLNSRSFIGLKPTPELRLYYHDNSVLPSFQNPDKHISFIVNNGNIMNNVIHGNRTATKLATLKTISFPIRSEETDHQAYIEGGVGLAMRIQIPYLKKLFLIQPGFQCTKAVLQLVPIRTSYRYQDNTPLPLTIQMSVVDAENKQLAAYTSGGLNTDQFGDSKYNIDITSFINGQLVIEGNNNNALFLRLTDRDYQTSVNRLYVGDSGNSNYTMRLVVYYITLADQ